MSFQNIDGLDITYALISFDEDGQERTDDPVGGLFSKTLIEKAQQEKPTDIFLFSHGWKGDIRAAIAQYNRWIGAMWRLDADRQAMGPDFKPMFIGLHWPSLPWGDEDMPSGASFADAIAAPVLNELFEKPCSTSATRPKSDRRSRSFSSPGRARGFRAARRRRCGVSRSRASHRFLRWRRS